jgi:hypothetical protein
MLSLFDAGDQDTPDEDITSTTTAVPSDSNAPSEAPGSETTPGSDSTVRSSTTTGESPTATDPAVDPVVPDDTTSG